MNAQAVEWLRYAKENLAVARLSKEHGYYNACLQNCQQSVEKALKAFVLSLGSEFRKTHSILELCSSLAGKGHCVPVSDKECAFLDSIYLPSKYPVESILPDIVGLRRERWIATDS